MLVGEGLGEVGRRAEVIAEHAVVVPLVDTAVRQDGDRQGVRVVRIGVQERVGCPDGGGPHRPVGLGLVGVVQDVVLPGGLGVFGRCDGAQFQFGDDLVLDLALDADVLDVQVDVVVRQLLLDVERGIVPGVELVRIQGAGGVQRVGVRVDVEVTLHFTGDGIQRGAEGTRRTLRTVGSVSDQVQGDVLEQPVRGVDVRGKTPDGALQGPARVVHHGEGCVVVARIRTARHGDGVVMLDVVGEEPVEPVRVAVLGRAEIGGLGGVGVRQAELAAGLVELGDELVHLAVDTAVGGVGRTGILQETLLLQFLVDGHLVLGIHDVEVRIAGLQAHRVLTGIGKAAVTGLSLLGGDDDDARHRARTIDRSRGTVLENVETLDIVGVQAGDGGRDQGIGITGTQVFRVDVHDILHDDAVNHPQRLGGAVDGSRTTDADLRGGTERTGNVLDRDTGHTAFQRAGNVRHTADLGVVGVQFDGGSREQTAVYLGHTGDDSLFQDFRIRLHQNTDSVLHWDFRFLIAHERDHEVLCALRYPRQNEVTVQVREGSDLGLAFHGDERSGDRFSVFGGDNRSPDRPRLRESGHQAKQEGTDTEHIG